MQYKVNFSDFIYEARYRSPLFIVAGSPVRVLDAVNTAISPKYPIASSDMVVEPGRAVGEVRARINLFGGNGALEFGSDFFSARFNNPRGDEDFQVVQDCIVLSHEALSKLADAARSIREEGFTLRLFCELVDGSDASTFLRGLFEGTRLLGPTHGFPANIVPGFVMDVFQDEERWAFNFSVSQAARSKKEIFLATSLRIFEGSKLSSIKEKADHFGNYVKMALQHINLDMQTDKPAGTPK